MSFFLFYDGGTVYLRSPELGDIRRLETYVENRETIGGELKSVKDANWPDKQIRVFTFRGLSASVAADLESAFISSAGTNVTVLDHNNEVWSGVILTNPMDIITQRDNNCGFYDVSFEMMCEYDGTPTAALNTDEEQIYNTDEEPIYII